MFDIAWSELALIGAVALIVIGPKDLPKVMRTMGQWTRKARLLAGEFHNNIDELIRQAELDDVRRQVEAVSPAAVKAKVESIFDPKDIERAIVGDQVPAGPAPDAGPAVAASPPVAESAEAESGDGQAAAAVPVPLDDMLPPIAPAEQPQAAPVQAPSDKPAGPQP
jgi:sec-independent protein translocase protein TatB